MTSSWNSSSTPSDQHVVDRQKNRVQVKYWNHSGNAYILSLVNHFSASSGSDVPENNCHKQPHHYWSDHKRVLIHILIEYILSTEHISWSYPWSTLCVISIKPELCKVLGLFAFGHMRRPTCVAVIMIVADVLVPNMCLGIGNDHTNCTVVMMSSDRYHYAIRITLQPLLTHLPLVPHICVSESGQHWFR